MENVCAIDRIILLVRMEITTPGLNPIYATDRAVPSVIGCSISRVTISQIDAPTEKAMTLIQVRVE